MKKDYYIYIHFNKITGLPFYIGRGKNRRAYQKTGRNKWWVRIANKYDFEIDFLEKELNNDESNDLEIYWIGQFRAWGFKLCNMTDGGKGCINRKYSVSSINKMINSHLGQPSGMKGKTQTISAKFKNRLAHLGKSNGPCKEHVQEKIRKKLTGVSHPPERVEKNRLAQLKRRDNGFKMPTRNGCIPWNKGLKGIPSPKKGKKYPKKKL